jgi:hypothetical protein
VTPRQSRYFWAVYINVLSYIVAKHTANHHRPVHIAGSIAARDLSISKTKWWRAIVVLELDGLIGCNRKVGGWRNLGATYWPTGHLRASLFSPTGHPSPNGSGTVTRIPAAPAYSGVDSRPGGFRIQSEVPRNASEVPRVEGVGNTMKSRESRVNLPLNRIHESTALVRSSLREIDGAAVEEGDGLRPSTNLPAEASPSTLTPAAPNPLHNPSHRPKRAAGRGVPVRLGNEETTVYPDAGAIPLDVQHEIRRILGQTR